MIYNFNLGIGWASSGVEYAQAYRAVMLRNIGEEAKFIFTDMFPQENIEHMTRNIGFLDSEVIWLYSFFTDYPIEPVSFTLGNLKETFTKDDYEISRTGKTGKCRFTGTDIYYTIYFVDETSDLVHRVEMVSNGNLIRKDYFTSGRLYSEYYAPHENKAHLYLRRFFNRDGSLAYEEIIDDGDVMYQFPDRFICSKEEFVGYFTSKLNLTNDDTIIIDRTTGIGQAILMNCGKARTGIVIHADHFNEGSTDDNNILWNNYYEYPFDMNRHIDFYVTSTDEQNGMLKSQFEKYLGISPKVYTIPVGGMESLKYPSASGRKPYSIMTASRLASEKHIDWLVEAVAKAHETLPEITFDIYGKGGEEEKLKKLIEEKNAAGYIMLKGQQNLKEVYQNYELYLAGSTSEGFGLTLMEAVGGGDAMIGFDVPYGNPTFIDEGENGFLIPYDKKMPDREKISNLANRIVRLFSETELEAFHNHSYYIAKSFLDYEVENRWKELMK